MAYAKKDPIDKALTKHPGLSNYRVVTVVSFERNGNSTTFKRDDHVDELEQLFLDGWYPFGNPFIDPVDNRTVYQAFIK